MTLYRNKGTTRAVQWFANGHCPVWAQPYVKEYGTYFDLTVFNTTVTGHPGDWIIQHVGVEHADVVRKSEFEKHYEKVAE